MKLWAAILILFVGFVLGVIFHAKAIDEPETSNSYEIGKIKTKGRGNSTDTNVSFPEKENTSTLTTQKKNIFKRWRERRKSKKL